MATKSAARRTQTPRAPKAKSKPAVIAGPEPDLDEALRLTMQMMALPGLSGREGSVAQFIMEQLRAAGAAEANIVLDTAHQRTPIPGEVGNLIFKLPGTLRARAGC